MTAFPCPTCGCESKDAQIAVLVEAAIQPRPNGHKWCALCGMWAQKDQEIDHSRTCVLANLPAAARERAEERERLRAVARKLRAILERQGTQELVGFFEEVAALLPDVRAALTGEEPNR